MKTPKTQGPLAALASLRAAIAPPNDKVPEGFRTMMQWARDWDVTRVHAARLVTEGVRLGKWKRVDCRVDGRKRPCYGPA
jgi:hypothetical protein